MNTRVRSSLSLVILLAGAVCPCSAQVSPADSTSLSTQTSVASAGESLFIGPGDQLTIRVFSTPELSGDVRVDGAGFATLPLGAKVQLAGLTAAQAGTAIEDYFKSNQIMLDPHVTVVVAQFATQGITMLGEVVHPGTFTLLGQHSLYDALAIAGGPTPNEGDSIIISHRADPDHPERIDVRSPNYSALQRRTMVLAGDTIVVSRASLVYVVGDVVRSGPISIVNGVPLSILNVLGLVQGLNRTAKSSHASIIRETDGKVVTIPLNLDKIMRSEEPNVLVQASDILVVPRSGAKTFLEFALPSATGAVLSAVASALIVR